MKDEFYRLPSAKGAPFRGFSLHLRGFDTGGFVVYSFRGARTGSGPDQEPWETFAELADAQVRFEALGHEARGGGYVPSTERAVWPQAAWRWRWQEWTVLEAARECAEHEAVRAKGRSVSEPVRRKAGGASRNERLLRALRRWAEPGSEPPPWMLSCFVALDGRSREPFASMLVEAFPAEADAIKLARLVVEDYASGPERTGDADPGPAPYAQVDWPRVVFARLPLDRRKRTYRRGAAILYAEAFSNRENIRRWIEAYKRFPSVPRRAPGVVRSARFGERVPLADGRIGAVKGRMKSTSDPESFGQKLVCIVPDDGMLDFPKPTLRRAALAFRRCYGVASPGPNWMTGLLEIARPRNESTLGYRSRRQWDRPKEIDRIAGALAAAVKDGEDPFEAIARIAAWKRWDIPALVVLWRASGSPRRPSATITLVARRMSRTRERIRQLLEKARRMGWCVGREDRDYAQERAAWAAREAEEREKTERERDARRRPVRCDPYGDPLPEW